MPLPLTVSCSSKIQIGFTFLVPAHPGSPGKEAVKWLLLLYINKAIYLSIYAAAGQKTSTEKGRRGGYGSQVDKCRHGAGLFKLQWTSTNCTILLIFCDSFLLGNVAQKLSSRVSLS